MGPEKGKISDNFLLKWNKWYHNVMLYIGIINSIKNLVRSQYNNLKQEMQLGVGYSKWRTRENMMHWKWLITITNTFMNKSKLRIKIETKLI